MQGTLAQSSAEIFRALPQTLLTRESGTAGWAEAMTWLVHRFRGLRERHAA